MAMILTAILTALAILLPQDSLRTAAFYTDSSGVSIYEPDTLSRMVTFPGSVFPDTSETVLDAAAPFDTSAAAKAFSGTAIAVRDTTAADPGSSILLNDIAPTHRETTTDPDTTLVLHHTISAITTTYGTIADTDTSLIFNDIASAPLDTASGQLSFEPLWDDKPEADNGLVNLQSVIDQDGKYWKTYETDGMYIFLNVRCLHQYGRYWQVDAYIQNNTDSTLWLDMSKARVDFVGGSSPVLSEERYLKTVKRRQFWSSFGLSAATFASVVVADLTAQGLRDKLYDDFYDGELPSFAADLAATVAVESIYAAAYIGSVALGEKFSRDFSRITAENIGWLRSSKVAPSHAIEGRALAKAARRAGDIVVTLNIGGKDYFFTWDSRRLEKVND